MIRLTNHDVKVWADEQGLPDLCLPSWIGEFSNETSLDLIKTLFHIR